MKRNIKYIIAAILIIALFTVFKLLNTDNDDLISGSIINDTVTIKELTGFKENYSGVKPYIAVFNEMESSNVSLTDLNHGEKAKIYSVSGKISLLCKEGVLRGNCPCDDDYEGCVIDEKLALKLFGSTDCLNKDIKYNDKIYYIRAVVKGNTGRFLYQSNDDKENFSKFRICFNKQTKQKMLGDSKLETQKVFTAMGKTVKLVKTGKIN